MRNSLVKPSHAGKSPAAIPRATGKKLTGLDDDAAAPPSHSSRIAVISRYVEYHAANTNDGRMLDQKDHRLEVGQRRRQVTPEESSRVQTRRSRSVHVDDYGSTCRRTGASMARWSR